MLAGPLSLLLLALSPEGAPEGEGAATFLGLPQKLWEGVNLVLFLGLLVYFLRKPLATYFGGRRREVEAALKRSEESRLRAEALAEEMRARLSKVEAELAAIHEHARKEGDEELAALTRQTEEDAARIVARAGTEMESRVRAARQELTAYAGDLAVQLATDLLKKEVGTEDHRRLITEGLTALGKGASSRAAASSGAAPPGVAAKSPEA